MATCIINDIETEANEKRAQMNEKLNIIHSHDLSLNLIEISKKYRDNIDSPMAKREVENAIAQFNNQFITGEMKMANDEIFSNSGAQRKLKEVRQAMQDYIEKENLTGNLEGKAGAVLTALTKIYKSMTIGSAVGRGITEGAQVWTITATNKLNQMWYSPYKRENIARMLGVSESKLPSPGDIRKTDFSKIETTEGGKEFSGNEASKSKLYEKLEYIPNKMMEIAGWGVNKLAGPAENVFYHTEFHRAMGEWANQNPKLKDILTKENLSAENKAKKNDLIQKWKREAMASTKSVFFDYSSNPLLINKLETFIPFTNFMYNGIKMLHKFPATFMFGATVLNNMQYAYGDDVWYTDEEGQKIDAGQSLRVPILASLGLDSVALNMNRMLQITPGSIGMKPASWYNTIFGREDPRFQKFYKSGSFADYADIGLSMVSPPISKLVNAIVNYNTTEDRDGKKVNATAQLNEALLYMTTGMIAGDKSMSAAWSAYIAGDYTNLLNMSSATLNRFLKEESNVKKGLTIQSLKALQKAKEIGVLDFEKDPFKNAIMTLSSLPIHDGITSKERLEHDGNIISTLAEVALGKNFSGADSKGEFADVLAKWKQMYKDPNFKEFEKAIPNLGKTIRHYVENEKFYKDRNDAYEAIESDDEKKKIDGELRLIMMNYRFEGDEGMSVSDKMTAFKFGKLNSPMYYGQSKDGVPAHSVKMTDEYLETLKFKGDLVVNYMEKTNAINAMNSLQKVFNDMAKATSSKTAKNKYYDLGKKVYNLSLKAEHEMKVMCSPEYALYQLSGDSKIMNYKDKSGNDYSKSTGWSNTYNDKRDKFLGTTKEERERQKKNLIDRLSNLTQDEKGFMNKVMNTNVDQNIKMQKGLLDSEPSLGEYSALNNLLNK